MVISFGLTVQKSRGHVRRGGVEFLPRLCKADERHCNSALSLLFLLRIQQKRERLSAQIFTRRYEMARGTLTDRAPRAFKEQAPGSRRAERASEPRKGRLQPWLLITVSAFRRDTPESPEYRCFGRNSCSSGRNSTKLNSAVSVMWSGISEISAFRQVAVRN